MTFLVDECLSHHYVRRFVERGYPDTIHPLLVGLRASRDDQILRRALADDRIIVTANAVDYRRLLAREAIHPGGILVEGQLKEPTWQLILVALAFLKLQPRPMDYMVNRVIEVSATDGLRPYELAAPDVDV